MEVETQTVKDSTKLKWTQIMVPILHVSCSDVATLFSEVKSWTNWKIITLVWCDREVTSKANHCPKKLETDRYRESNTREPQ